MLAKYVNDLLFHNHSRINALRLIVQSLIKRRLHEAASDPGLHSLSSLV